MNENTSKSARGLRLVAPGEQLRGRGPQAWERLLRTAAVGSPDHRGALRIALVLTRHCLSVAVPPSAQVQLHEGLHAVQNWLEGGSATPAQQARAVCFAALPVIERITAEAVAKSKQTLPERPVTFLDSHADHVMLRFARLGAHHAAAAVCHLLDGVDKPESAVEVPSDVVGARAYQTTCLGSTRHQDFRNAAVEQAEWEAPRCSGESEQSLALQIFHEYLGARWRAAADMIAVSQNEFISWALQGRATSDSRR